MKSKVYFTKNITSENLIKFFDALNVKLDKEVAIKLHSGEDGNQNYIKPEFFKPFIDYIDGTVVECNTAYEGARNETSKHKELLKKNGWNIFKTDILDGDGEIEVSEGTNKITIKVTAENGNTKEYIINATVKEYDPIEVKVNNEAYTVIRKKDDLPKPSSTYEETTIKIKDNEIPAFKSDITKYTLVGLKDEKGNIKLYVYDETTEKYTLYNEISFNKLTIYPTNEEFSVSSNFVKETKNIGDIPVLLYTDNKNKDFSIFMGINIETGEKNIYEYDSKENTIQRYKKDDIKTKTNDNIYLYASFGLGALLVVTYLVIIISLVKKKPKKIKLNYDKNN